MIRAVIFDLDGVTINGEPIHSKSVEIVLKKYGKTPIYNANGLVHEVGIADPGEYRRLLEKYGLVSEEESFRRKRRRAYIKLINQKLTPGKGFMLLMKILNKHNIKTAIASNRNAKHIKIILKNIKADKLFNTVSGLQKNVPPKPAPDIYLIAAKKIKVDPKDCWALEDTEVGIASAKAAGMRAIAIPNKYTYEQDFSKADLIVNSLKDIKWSTLNI